MQSEEDLMAELSYQYILSFGNDRTDFDEKIGTSLDLKLTSVNVKCKCFPKFLYNLTYNRCIERLCPIRIRALKFDLQLPP